MADFITWIPLISSFAAVAAAVAAWRAAKETQKTTIANVVIQIREAYASPEMLKTMMTLLDWKEKHGSDFAKVFGQLWLKRDPNVDKINFARRHYAHQFHTIRFLLEAGVIKRNVIKRIVPKDEVKFLVEVVEPLERQLPTFESTMIDTFRKIYKIS